MYASREETISELFNEHMQLIALLNPCNMSGDETDSDRPTKRTKGSKTPSSTRHYWICESEWMSMQLRDFLRSIDTYRLISRQGNLPRVRELANPRRLEVGHPPKGLWRNCYSSPWLCTLKPHEKRALFIVDGNYDFTIRVPNGDDDAEESGAGSARPEFQEGNSRGV